MPRFFGLVVVVLMGGYGVQCANTGEIQGGAPCEYDVQCGDLPANAIELRRTGFSASDMTTFKGTCDKVTKTCKCASPYGCATCAIQQQNVRTCPTCGTYVWTNNATAQAGPQVGQPVIDQCTLSGGGACSQDAECLNGGLCLKGSGKAMGFCSCPNGYTCSYCSLSLSALTYGAKCPTNSNSSKSFASGGARCTSSADCGGHGSCTNGICKCVPSKACPDCSGHIAALVAGTESCGCENVYCGGTANGYCGGNGDCVCHFPWAGPTCTTNPCNPDGAGDICRNKPNSACLIDPTSRVASCACTGNYGRDASQQCTVPPQCQTDADCGVWAPVPLLARRARRR